MAATLPLTEEMSLLLEQDTTFDPSAAGTALFSVPDDVPDFDLRLQEDLQTRTLAAMELAGGRPVLLLSYPCSSVRVNSTHTLEAGTLFFMSGRLHWKPQAPGAGFSMDYASIVVAAVSAAEGDGEPLVFVQIASQVDTAMDEYEPVDVTFAAASTSDANFLYHLFNVCSSINSSTSGLEGSDEEADGDVEESGTDQDPTSADPMMAGMITRDMIQGMDPEQFAGFFFGSQTGAPPPEMTSEGQAHLDRLEASLGTCDTTAMATGTMEDDDEEE
ncbi:hypothetical protein H696_01759 [Fonticula alba]|uniref:Chloride conductance regulatory protein ICln n=1 Tax=Fonticula alba TaxID=691883 RepID=A0A058ZEJ0_FONAL|nr:hypothetical protein H696_01759 [Fonticula alba]KCV72366.1 hypothetical protein H696_01759 [Fonticula alba]|eukprot:XP_009493944.1 hypothetical protein H696_01759 [Fonticula alba]